MWPSQRRSDRRPSRNTPSEAPTRSASCGRHARPGLPERTGGAKFSGWGASPHRPPPRPISTPVHLAGCMIIRLNDALGSGAVIRLSPHFFSGTVNLPLRFFVARPRGLRGAKSEARRMQAVTRSAEWRPLSHEPRVMELKPPAQPDTSTDTGPPPPVVEDRLGRACLSGLSPCRESGRTPLPSSNPAVLIRINAPVGP